MSLKERLEARAPKNESTILLRRTRLEFEQDRNSHLAPVRKRLLTSGVFEVLEELLETVEDSRFSVSPNYQEFPPQHIPATAATALICSWAVFKTFEHIDGEPDLKQTSRRSVKITAFLNSDNIEVASREDTVLFFENRRDPLLPSGKEVFRKTLSPKEWQNGDLFETTIVEALTLAALTRSQLNLGN